MKKDKTWIVDLFGIEQSDKKIEQIANAEFWTTDTNAFLNFRPLQQDFDFETATISLYNKDDKSTISATTEVVNNEASYEMSADVISRYGQWTAQVIFTRQEEDYTSPLIRFEVKRHLLEGISNSPW